MSTAVPIPAVAEVPPGAEPVLETENLVKVYGRGASRFDALKGITLQIQRGESLAVVGKSGSGKSTLMHLLALLDQPSAGVVAMDGRPVSQLKAAEISQLRNERFGFVFQQFFLNPNQTNPTVLFADEPTGNLDSATSAAVEDILFGLHRDEGITLVVVTHDDDLAAKCDRRVELQDGVVIADERVGTERDGARA